MARRLAGGAALRSAATCGSTITWRRLFWILVACVYLFTLQHYFGRRVLRAGPLRDWLADRGLVQRQEPFAIPVLSSGGGGRKYNRSFATAAPLEATAGPTADPTAKKTWAPTATQSPADWSLGRHRLSPFELRIARKQSVRFDTRAVTIEALRNRCMPCSLCRDRYSFERLAMRRMQHAGRACLP